MATATVATIEERRLTAVEASRLAYAPLPPTTPGAPALCWQGRLLKAMKLGHEAMQAGEHDRAKQIHAAIDKLNESANKAHETAQQAMADYQGMCAALGRKPVDVMPKDCTCEGCQIARAQTDYFTAEAKLRKALFDLIMPYEATDKLPYLVQLVDAQDTKKLWGLLITISEAMKAYRAAGEAFGVDLGYKQWHKVLE